MKKMFKLIHLYTVLIHKICPIYADQMSTFLLSGKYILCYQLLYQMFITPANNVVNDEIHDYGKNKR